MKSNFFETHVRIINSEKDTLIFQSVQNTNYTKKLLHGFILLTFIVIAFTISALLPEETSFLFFLFILYVLAFANYAFLDKFSTQNEQQTAEISHLTFSKNGIVINSDNNVIDEFHIDKINSITIEKSGRYNLKIQINNSSNITYNLLVKNLFVRPNIINEINAILNLEKYAEYQLKNTKISISKKKDYSFHNFSKYHSIREHNNCIIISISTATITVNHSDRNITTQTLIGHKRYISFDQIASIEATSHELSILDIDGHKFILHQFKKLENTLTVDAILRRLELEFIKDRIDVSIKNKVIESLDKLDLSPLPQNLKNKDPI